VFVCLLAPALITIKLVIVCTYGSSYPVPLIFTQQRYVKIWDVFAFWRNKLSTKSSIIHVCTVTVAASLITPSSLRDCVARQKLILSTVWLEYSFAAPERAVLRWHVNLCVNQNNGSWTLKLHMQLYAGPNRRTLDSLLMSLCFYILSIPHRQILQPCWWVRYWHLW
jgi:hypothetical protein